MLCIKSRQVQGVTVDKCKISNVFNASLLIKKKLLSHVRCAIKPVELEGGNLEATESKACV